VPLALCAALLGVLLIVDPQVRDLSAHVLRTELFEDKGFAVWNGSWYGGHYLLTYSVLFPPLAAVLTPQLVGALAAVASAYLFDRIVRERWGPPAIWASLWFAVLAAAIFANGNLAFGLGVAFGLVAVLALQRLRPWLAIAAGVACSLSSPVAAAFLAGIALVLAFVDRDRRGSALALSAATIVPFAALNLLFPEQSEQPFSFASWIVVPLWCAGALLATRTLPRERGLRIAFAGYAAVATAIWLIPNPLGDNALRLAAFFGGPILLAALLARRPFRLGVLGGAAAVATLAWSLYWPLADPIDELADASGDAATEAAYFEPLKEWLGDHGGNRARIEIPVTLNSWESAYVAPDFALARGWLRQLDVERNRLFFDGELTERRYASWLRRNGVRYVALPDAPIHKYALAEGELLRSEPDFLRLRWASEHWRVWEVSRPDPLVSSADGGRASIAALDARSFTVTVERPGTFTVLVRSSPYWELVSGSGCIADAEPWTVLRADQPGPFRVEADFSLDAGWRSLRRVERSC
jgi:hypothetical protein